MLKKFGLLCSAIVLFVLGIFAFTYYKKASVINKTTYTMADLKKENFINQQQAVLYTSSTTEELQKGKGNGKVIFIDQLGNARGLKLSGIENGGTFYNQDQLMIEDSKRILLLSNTLHTYEMVSKELRGIQTGFLPKTKQFYSLYNTGFSKKEDYKTIIRYGNEKAMKVTSVPFFVSAVGELSDSLILLTQDLVTGKFAIQKVQLGAKGNTKKWLELPLQDAEDLDALTPVVMDNTNYYFIMTNYQSEEHEDLELIIINQDTKNVKTKPLLKYRTKYQVENALPYNFNHSAYANNGSFYYVNGLGEVYEYNFSHNDVQKVMQLHHEKNGNSRFEQLSFRDNQIHYIYSNKNRKFFLETYDLSTKKRIKKQRINHLESILPMDDENYFMTNLEMLDT
ncbi:hypothetical protein ACWV26_06020 [Rummeliibacillus sp. JY-2-4R]